MVRATADRDASRLMIFFAPAIFLLSQCGAMLVLNFSNVSSESLGFYNFGWFFFASFILMVFAAVRLASDVTGLRDASWLDLLKLTGISPRHWICLRVVQIGMSFMFMWFMRLPVLLLILTFGGLRTTQVLQAESLLLFTFIVAVCLGLLGSYAGQDRRRVWGVICGGLIGTEFLLYLPNKLLSLPLFQPLAFSTLTDVAERLTAFRLVPVYWSAMSGGMLWTELWLPISLYAAIASISLIWFSSVIFQGTSGEGLQSNSESITNHNYMTGSRCWEDALAWQAYQYHGGGKRTELIYLSGYLLASGLIIVFLYYRMLDDLWGLFAVAAPVVLLMKVSLANNCLEKEIKAQTLTTLMLTPYHNVEFYHGWHRGAWRMLQRDLYICGTAALIAFYFEPMMTSVTVIVTIGILLSGPFLLLSALVPITLKGVPISFAVVGVLIVIIISGIVIGAIWSPIIGALFSVFLVWVFNVYILKKLLPEWMDYKMLGVINNEV